MGKSLKEYVSALGYWGLIVIAPIVLDIVGVYQLASGNQFTGVPSWVWFQVAFVFLLIIPFIAFHKVRVKRDELKIQLDDKAKNKKIRECIAEYLTEGNQLAVIDQSKEPPTQKVLDWVKRVANYLKENLGEDYMASFLDGHGLPIHFTRLSSLPHVDMLSILNTSLARLQQFLAELRN